MLKERLKHAIQVGVEKSFGLLTKPFAEADTLESYSDRGYILLGLSLTVLTLVCWWWNLFNTPLSRSDSLIYALFEWILQRAGGPKSLPERYVTTLFLPLIVYALVGIFFRSARRWIGEQVANSSFWLINKAIASGEWFIEHRWYSLLFIIFLTSLLAYLFHIHSERQRIENERQRLNDSFTRWLEATGDFIEHNPFSKVEKGRYDRIKPLWSPDFEASLRLPNGTAHPATCLNAILENIYGDETPLSDKLTEENLSKLTKLAGGCSRRSLSEMTVQEARAHALINMLLGPAYLRSFDASKNRNYENLIKASEHFDNIKLNPGADEKIARDYASIAANGKGWIYSVALDVYLDTDTYTLLSEKQRKNLGDICDGVNTCAEKAFDYYKEAGKDYKGCTYQHKREINNVMDLFLRLGDSYGDARVREIKSPQIAKLLKSPVVLANQIEEWIGELMSCNNSGFESAHVLTVAQAYAIRVSLWRMAPQEVSNAAQGAAKPADNAVSAPPAQSESQQAEEHVAKKIDFDLSASGRYLRLYNSFEKGEAPKYVTGNTFFCSVLTGGAVDPKFHDALVTVNDALPSAEPLETEIQKRCSEKSIKP